MWGGAFVGGHYANASDATCTTYEVSITHLDSWYPWVGITDDEPQVDSAGHLSRTASHIPIPRSG